MQKRERIKLTSDEANRVSRTAESIAIKLIAGETLRLALPIARLIHEKIIAEYKVIQGKHGEVI